LVISYVKKIKKAYPFLSLEFEDLCQEGCIGLMKAVDKFDWKKGYRFSTYAIPWIRISIMRFVNNRERTIRLPISQIERIKRYEKTKRKLFQELKRSPTIQEVAEEMKMNLSEVRFLKEIEKRTSSLEELLWPGNGDDSDNALIDFIKDEKINPSAKVEEEDLKKRVRESLLSLKARERKILMIRFGLEDGTRHTLEEVGKIFHRTRERIQQIEKESLEKLRRRNPRLKELLR